MYPSESMATKPDDLQSDMEEKTQLTDILRIAGRSATSYWKVWPRLFDD
jgi:hypothetical protein